MATHDQQPFIRLYEPADKDNALHIFRSTADPAVQIEPISTIGAHIWCLSYLTLSPKTCFVLDDGSGRAVGYCIGTPDTGDFTERWERELVPTIERDLRRLPVSADDVQGEEERRKVEKRRDELCRGIYDDPRALVYASYAEYLKDYPGHLHIDILPSHQRRGWGGKLVGVLLAAFREAGCKGLYLGMVAGNADAARFYEREGFCRLPFVLDEGASGESGRTKGEGGGGGVIYYVNDL